MSVKRFNDTADDPKHSLIMAKRRVTLAYKRVEMAMHRLEMESESATTLSYYGWGQGWDDSDQQLRAIFYK